MGNTLQEQLDWLEQAREAVFCWDYDPSDMDSRFPGERRLPQPLVDSIVRQPVPIGLNRLHTSRRSSPGHDLYLWLAYRTSSLALPWAQVYARHGPVPEKAGDNLTIRNRREKVSPGTEENQPRLARIEILDRAMAAHSSPTRRRRSPASAGPAPTLECASDASAVLPRFSPGDRWASRLSHSLTCSILCSGLGLPPAARLALGPLGRRKPAARTLTLAQRGRLSTCLAHAALERPCTRLRFVLPAVGFGRCRQSRVSGKRSQTLNA